MSTMRGSFSVLVAGAVAAVAVSAVVVTQATGESGPDAPQVSRAAAYLAATQGELEGTQHRVSTVRLDHAVEGREIYVLRGEDTRCILVAGAAQEPGHSESLACSDNEDVVDRPFQSGFDTAGGGRVDVVWTDTPGARASASGGSVEVRVGATLIAAIRTDGTIGGELRWSAAGSPSVQLLSASERDERARAALAAVGE